MHKIATIVGARPQIIKAAAISWALRGFSELREVMIHTGQHYDPRMSGVFFGDLDIPEPEYNLEVGSASHAAQTGEMMRRLEEVLLKIQPGLVVLYGDSNSTLAAAITAAKLNIPAAHVEAGLRSFNRRMPEEINRVVADQVSTLLFCPTRTAVENLASEGIRKNVFHAGDVMYDVALRFCAAAESGSRILEQLGLERKEYVLATIHRAENTDCRERLSAIFEALGEISRERTVVLPLHPRTKKMLQEFGIPHGEMGIRKTEPAGFRDMLLLLQNAAVVATDSGGLQKEAYFHRVPCVTFRDQTEWVETVRSGWNVLVKAGEKESVAAAIRKSLTSPGARTEISDYGDGTAARKIVKAIAEYLEGGEVSVPDTNGA